MPELLSLLSGGIVGGFVGAFFGGFAKFFWEHWLPSRLTWKREQKVKRKQLLSQYRDPAIRVISELKGRLFAILLNISEAGNYIYLKKTGQGEYYILSTSFLIAQFFAWVEILRSKVAMLDYSELISKIENATWSFAYGGPGFQIFRLEQREIGERILSLSNDPEKLCCGYAEFVDLIGRNDVPTCLAQLEKKVRHLMENPVSEMIRMARIQHATIDLIEFIDPGFQWVPKDKRDKFDVIRQLGKMQNRDEIDEDDYNNLLGQAKASGILID